MPRLASHVSLSLLVCGLLAVFAPPAPGAPREPRLLRVGPVLTGLDLTEPMGLATDERYAVYQARAGVVRVLDSWTLRRHRDVSVGGECRPLMAHAGDALMMCENGERYLIITLATGVVAPIANPGGAALTALGRHWVGGIQGQSTVWISRTGEVRSVFGDVSPFDRDLDSPGLEPAPLETEYIGSIRCADGSRGCIAVWDERGDRLRLVKRLGRQGGNRALVVGQPGPFVSWWHNDTAWMWDRRRDCFYRWRFRRRAPAGAIVMTTARAAFFVRPARRRYPSPSTLYASRLTGCR